MNIEESIQQIETLIEAWRLDEADLNQTDINAMQVLLKENQEQNKQLEENKNPLRGIFAQVNDDTLLRNCGAMQSEIDKFKTQQQEFIKYLENEIEKQKSEIFEKTLISEDIDIYIMRVKLSKLEEILTKYKEIIGDKDEK